MRKFEFNKNINCFGELSDSELENEFLQKNMKKTINSIKIISILLGVLNTLFLIPDYFFVESLDSFAIICSIRVFFVFIIVLLTIFVNKITSHKTLFYVITAYEVVCIISFIFVFYRYESPDYLIQSFGVMVIITGIFMVPNRLINKIAVSIIIIIFFNFMSIYYIDNISMKELSAVIVYLLIILILSSINSFRDDYYKRVHYVYNKELIRLSTTDTLTGVYNRAKFNQEFKRNIDYAKRYGTPLSLIIIDFDDFKRINDNYGHLAGDGVIIQFVEIVNKNIRVIDIFARWGGEEFVLLLPNTDLNQGMATAERLRCSIEKYVFENADKITCSFGVAQYSEDDDMESLLHKADKMLYEVKGKGKNGVRGYVEEKSL